MSQEWGKREVTEEGTANLKACISALSLLHKEHHRLLSLAGTWESAYCSCSCQFTGAELSSRSCLCPHGLIVFKVCQRAVTHHYLKLDPLVSLHGHVESPRLHGIGWVGRSHQVLGLCCGGWYTSVSQLFARQPERVGRGRIWQRSTLFH